MVDGAASQHDERTRRGPWWHDPLVQLFLFTTLLLAVLESGLVLALGRGPVIVELAWVEAAAESFAALVALSIAFLSLGKLRVTGDRALLWIALAFWMYSLFTVLYILSIQGLVDSRGFLTSSGSTSSYFFHLSWTSLTVFLLLAAFASGRSRTGLRWTNGALAVLLVVSAAIAVLLATLILAYEAYLPLLIVDNAFSALNIVWIGIAGTLGIAGAVLGIWRYHQGGDRTLAYAATVALMIGFRLLSDLQGGQLFDVMWYVNRALVIVAFAGFLIGIIRDYVGLLRREQVLTGLAESRARQLEATIQSIPDAVVLVDPTGKVVAFNQAAASLMGFESEERQLNSLWEYPEIVTVMYPDGRDMPPKDYPSARALRGEVVRNYELLFRNVQSKEFVIEASSSPVRDAEGNIMLAVTVLRDVTELRRIREREAISRVATAMAEELEWERVVQTVLDQARTVLNADGIAVALAEPEERRLRLLGQVGLPAQARQALVETGYDAPMYMARAAATGEMQVVEDLRAAPTEFELARSLGERYGFQSMIEVPLKVRDRLVGVLGCFWQAPRRFSSSDLETIRTIARLFAVGLDNSRLFAQTQQEWRRLQAVIEHSPEGVVFVDASTDRISTNHMAELLFGMKFDSDGSRRQYARYLYRPNGEPFPFEGLPTTRALKGETVIGEEMLIRQPAGKEVPILASAAPIRDEEGQNTGAVVVFQDISPLKELERLREEFISIIAHDLRAPLTTIIGYTQLLERAIAGRQPTETEQRAVDSILSSAKRLNRMVSDLLDVSRIEAGRLTLIREAVDLPDLIQTTVQHLAPTLARHPVQVEASGEVLPVWADPARVEQILTNLLTNAAKYSAPGTEITIGVAPEDGEVQVSVADRGPGIPPGEIPRLFQRFYRSPEVRREQEGLGLGLYITKGLVEAHGGRIWVESRPSRKDSGRGKGSTFYFTLPVAKGGE